MTKVFISYSRKDKTFAGKLTEALEKSELETWIDWEDIPPTADWMEQIHKGIEQADAFLFILSPDSVASKVCGQEMDHALQNGKRLIPIVARDVNPNDVHPALAKVNWVYGREQDDFDGAVNKTLSAIRTDLAWVEAHRRLQVRALEWDKRRDNSLLLRGKDLREAEEQLASAGQKDPQPTDLQRQYILESRRGESRTRNVLLAISAVVMVVLVIASVIAVRQSNYATSQAGTAVAESNMRATAEANAVSEANMRATAQAEAEGQSRISRARELSTIANSNLKIGPSLSLLLSVEAVKLADISPSRNALLSVFLINKSPYIKKYLQNNRTHFRFGGSILGVYSAGIYGDGQITLLEAHSGEKVGEINSNYYANFDISPDGKILATGEDENILLFNISNPAEPVKIETLKLKTTQLWADTLLFSPNGKILAIVTGSNEIVLINIETRQQIGAPLICEPNTKLVFSPDSKSLIFYSINSREINFWNLDNQQITKAPFKLADFEGNLTSLAISPTGEYLAMAIGENIVMGDMNTRHLIGKINCERSIDSIAFSPDGRRLASGGYRDALNNTSREAPIDIWNMENSSSPSKETTLWGHSSTVTEIAFSQDGKSMVSTGYDNTILWDVGKLVLSDTFITPTGKNQFDAFALSPDDHLVATSECTQRGEFKKCINNEIKLLSLTTNSQNKLGEMTTVDKLLFSPKGNLLVVLGCKEGQCNQSELVVWNIDKQTKVVVIPTELVAAAALTFNPDGTLILAGGCLMQGQNCVPAIRFWDAETFQQTRTPLIAAPESFRSQISFSITALTYRPDGQELAIGLDSNGGVSTWGLGSGQPLYQRTIIDQFRTSDVNGVLFSSRYQEWLISTCLHGMYDSCLDGEILLVESSNPSSLRALSEHLPANKIALHPEGQVLAKAYGDAITLWDISNQQQIGTDIRDANDHILNLAFSFDGKFLFAQNSEAVMTLDLQEQAWTEKACNIAGRNLSHLEWAQYFPGENYRKTCQQWPLPQMIVKNMAEQALFNSEASYKVKTAYDKVKAALQNEPGVKDLPAETARVIRQVVGEQIIIEVKAGRFEQAQDLYNQLESIQLSLTDDAQFQIIRTLGEQIKAAAVAGDFKQAQNLMVLAKNLQVDKADTSTLNNICWVESLWGYPQDALQYCEQAINLAPESASYYDSRGLARALTGDFAGAILDFQHFVDEWIKAGNGESDTVKQRQQWIADLKAGRDPFTPDVIEMLKSQ